MKTDFDTLWENTTYTRCPLTDEQMEGMIARAQTQTPSVEEVTQPPHRPFRWWLAPLAVAAGLAIILIPVRQTTLYAAGPQQVDYHGQQVRFVCNSGCDVETVIGSLNSYLVKS